jgi:hypothetical protein
VTDETSNATAPDDAPAASPPAGSEGAADEEATQLSPPGSGQRPAAGPAPHRPDYKGAELDPERGPGLGCFWFQMLVLAFFILLIPVGLSLAWPFELLAFLLFVVIGLLLLTGQTVIFLLRLVAADRRTRRRPLASATRTVGEVEDQQRVAHAVGGAPRSSPMAPGESGSGPEPPPPADEPPPPADEPIDPGSQAHDTPRSSTPEEGDPGVRQ